MVRPILNEPWSYLLYLAELKVPFFLSIFYNSRERDKGHCNFSDADDSFSPAYCTHWVISVMPVEIGKAYQIEDIGRNQKENTWIILQVTLWGNVMGVTKYIKENG